MAKDIHVHWGFRDGSDQDFRFYRLLPGAKERAMLPGGEPAPLGRNATEVLFYIGFAALSSTTLATAIKAYIEGKKRKITVSISGTEKKIEYEGSNFSEDVNTIEAMIDKLIEDTRRKDLTLHAKSYETVDERGGAEWDRLSQVREYLQNLEKPTEKQSSAKESSNFKDDLLDGQ